MLTRLIRLMRSSVALNDWKSKSTFIKTLSLSLSLQIILRQLKKLWCLLKSFKVTINKIVK